MDKGRKSFEQRQIQEEFSCDKEVLFASNFSSRNQKEFLNNCKQNSDRYRTSIKAKPYKRIVDSFEKRVARVIKKIRFGYE